MSVYGLEEEERKSVEEIFNNFPQLKAVESYRKALNEMTDKALDELTAYMQDEYVLRFEEIVWRQAKKVVEALLRGENLDTFGLKLREYWNEPGKYHAYDGEKCRAALVRDFKSEIYSAEMHTLKEENERLLKDVEYYRRRA